jgi:DHA1 family tetracycline resistance protein-like MFS transporter
LGYFISIPVMMIWTISGPAAQGMMTHRVSASEQGELQGAISSLRAIAVIIGPGLFTFTFAYFIDVKHGWNLPGAPWYLGAALLFFAMVMSLRIQQPRNLPAEVKSTEPSPIVGPSV